ncbi:MAG: type II CAAX endopeptidase family protein [Gemmatimonadaceae bacterium]
MTAPAPSASHPRFKRSIRPFLFVIAFYLLTLLAIGLLQALSDSFALGSVATGVISQWITLTSVVVATYVMLRRVEKLPWSVVGLDLPAAAPPILVKGAALGLLTIGIPSLILLAAGQLRILPGVPGSSLAKAGESVVFLLPAAFFEELFVRGYAFSVIRRMSGWKMALIITSVVFGLLHAANPGANASSILAVTVAGFFLGAVLLATGSLYAAGAAHFAWNWVMMGALHTPVSGLQTVNPDYTVVDAGPDWLTGGPWGPESGLLAVVAMFAVLFYLYGRHLRRMEPRA